MTFRQAVQSLYTKLGGLVIVLGVVHDPKLSQSLDSRFGGSKRGSVFSPSGSAGVYGRSASAELRAGESGGLGSEGEESGSSDATSLLLSRLRMGNGGE